MDKKTLSEILGIKLTKKDHKIIISIIKTCIEAYLLTKILEKNRKKKRKNGR